jgi:hypothetical protein
LASTIIVKTYSVTNLAKDAVTRYSPAAVVAVSREVVSGDPDQYVSTSYVERQNLSLRMHYSKGAIYCVLQDQQTRALAGILKRFFKAQSVPLPMDPLDLAGSMTALPHGRTLRRPEGKPGAPIAVGRVIGALLKLLTQR